VLSDYESNPFVEASLGELFHKPPRIHTIFIRVWNVHERIWKPNGQVDPLYLPDPTGARTVQSLAAATRGRAFGEGDVEAIVRAARTDIGTGTVRRARIDRARTPIAGWLALAALVPLTIVLRRRNVFL
jgi:Synergist-CTERM protein sorting domain-containing protein